MNTHQTLITPAAIFFGTDVYVCLLRTKSLQHTQKSISIVLLNLISQAAIFFGTDVYICLLSLSLLTVDMSAVRGSSHYSWASWSRGFAYFLANGVCLAECSKQFFNKFWVVFQADFCVLWVKSCSVRQDGVQKVYCLRSSQIFVWIAEQ